MAVRSPVTRSVRRPTISQAHQDRLPPGQVLTTRWPVLHHGEIPAFDPVSWDFRVFGLVDEPLRLTWDAFQTLPRVTVTADFHCVTRWSKLDNTWEGVSFRAIAERARPRPNARFVLFHCEGGYTANLPLTVLTDDDVLFALKHNGADLSPEHGFPVRAVVPKRYAWKSAKWLRGVEFLADDRAGFCECYGYSHSADPWKEERFSEYPSPE